MSQENVDVIRRIYAVWGKEGSPVPSGLLDQQIEWVLGERVERGGAVPRLDDLVAVRRQRPGHNLAEVVVVLDHEHTADAAVGGVRGVALHGLHRRLQPG